MAGVAATVVDWGTFAALHASGLPPEPSVVGSLMAGTVTNFALNRSYTFRSAERVGWTGPRYALVWIASVVSTVALVAGLTTLGVPAVTARVVTTGLLFPINFVLLKWFAFRGPAASRPSGADAKQLTPEDA